MRKFARFELDRSLDAIAGGQDLSEIVFNLVEWACRTGHQDELITALQHQRPDITLSFQGQQYMQQSAKAAANVVRLTIHYSEIGLLVGDRKEYEAKFAEAMYEVGEGGSLNIDLRFGYEDVMNEGLAKINSEPLTPERRIVVTQIKSQLKQCDRIRSALLFEIPYLFRPPLSFHLQEYPLVVECIEGLGISLFSYNSAHYTEGLGIDVWDPKKQICAKFRLDAAESASVEQQIGLPISYLDYPGWYAADLPHSVLCRKAIPAVLLELSWLHSSNPSQFSKLDLTSALTVNSWRIGWHDMPAHF